ncbi:hypothetical protein Ddc_06973 [Ditylenchus destructor]|nr:hypothetical protein Ddc_06973 [Ditylenchus destructor]
MGLLLRWRDGDARVNNLSPEDCYGFTTRRQSTGNLIIGTVDTFLLRLSDYDWARRAQRGASQNIPSHFSIVETRRGGRPRSSHLASAWWLSSRRSSPG